MFSDSSVNHDHSNCLGYDSTLLKGRVLPNRETVPIRKLATRSQIGMSPTSLSGSPFSFIYQETVLLNFRRCQTNRNQERLLRRLRLPLRSFHLARRRRVHLDQGRPNSLVALLCGTDRKAASPGATFQLLPSLFLV